MFAPTNEETYKAPELEKLLRQIHPDHLEKRELATDVRPWRHSGEKAGR